MGLSRSQREEQREDRRDIQEEKTDVLLGQIEENTAGALVKVASEYTEILSKIEEHVSSAADDARVQRLYTGLLLIVVTLLLFLFSGVFFYSIFIRT